MSANPNPGRPVAVAARLRFSDDAVALLRAAVGTEEKKLALRAAHDELAATLVPRLEHLRKDGAIIDFATSWVLEEVVAHAAADRVDLVRNALASFPELRDVSTKGLSGHRRR